MSSLSGLVLFFFSLSRLVSESFQERTFDFASLCWFCVLGILFCQCFFLSCVFFAPEDCLKNSPFVRSFFFSPPRLVSENFRERTFDFEALCLFCVWVYCFANVFALLRDSSALCGVVVCVCVSVPLDLLPLLAMSRLLATGTSSSWRRKAAWIIGAEPPEAAPRKDGRIEQSLFALAAKLWAYLILGLQSVILASLVGSCCGRRPCTTGSTPGQMMSLKA